MQRSGANRTACSVVSRPTCSVCGPCVDAGRDPPEFADRCSCPASPGEARSENPVRLPTSISSTLEGCRNFWARDPGTVRGGSRSGSRTPGASLAAPVAGLGGLKCGVVLQGTGGGVSRSPREGRRRTDSSRVGDVGGWSRCAVVAIEATCTVEAPVRRYSEGGRCERRRSGTSGRAGGGGCTRRVSGPGGRGARK